MTSKTNISPKTLHAEKKRIRQILVPTDFSETAYYAFEYALQVTEMLDAKLILLHVYQNVPVGRSYMPTDFVEALKGQRLKRANELLQKYLAEAQRKWKNNVWASSFLRSGHEASEIVEAASDQQVDLIIMGTRGGDSPFERTIGSVTGEVIRRAHCPVLAVPAGVAFKPIKKVMYALGMESNDPIFIEQVFSLTKTLGAGLICTNIQEDEASWQEVDLPYVKVLEELEKYDKLDLSIYQNEDVIKGLKAFIRKNNIDIVAMKTHQNPISSSHRSKSLTRKMLMETKIPLLAIQDM